MAKNLIVLAGPTAVGKTALSIQLAQHFNTTIVSCDSRQLYKELNIGVAKPNLLELATVKHHFINHTSIHETFNAGLYEKQSNALLEQLFKEHHTLLMVGGTGMYIKAATEGLDTLPTANTDLRIELQTLLKTDGIAAIQQRLAQLDPTANIKDRNNPQRLIRAIEIIATTGKPLADTMQKGLKKRDYTTHLFYLNMDRDKLYERINERVDLMIEAGLMQEVESLLPHQHLKALQTVGYTELFAYFNGKHTQEQAINKIKQHSRNYAKRQITWFRNQGYKPISSNCALAIEQINAELD